MGLRKSVGHAEELQEFVRAIQEKPNRLLSWEGSSLATACMFAAQESIRQAVEIDMATFRSSLLREPDEEPASTVSGSVDPAGDISGTGTTK